MENKELIKKSVWMGSGICMVSLLNTIEDEIYWQVLKDRDGTESYPYHLEINLVGGRVRDYWEVVQHSHYSVMLHIFENEELYREWIRSIEYREHRGLKKNDGYED